MLFWSSPHYLIKKKKFYIYWWYFLSCVKILIVLKLSSWLYDLGYVPTTFSHISSDYMSPAFWLGTNSRPTIFPLLLIFHISSLRGAAKSISLSALNSKYHHQLKSRWCKVKRRRENKYLIPYVIKAEIQRCKNIALEVKVLRWRYYSDKSTEVLSPQCT